MGVQMFEIQTGIIGGGGNMIRNDFTGACEVDEQQRLAGVGDLDAVALGRNGELIQCAIEHAVIDRDQWRAVGLHEIRNGDAADRQLARRGARVTRRHTVPPLQRRSHAFEHLHEAFSLVHEAALPNAYYAFMDGNVENRIDHYPHWKANEWRPKLPQGRIDAIYIHWSAHDYASVYPAYHFCVAIDDGGDVIVVNTHDVRENMREVYASPDEPYAAHTRNRNSFALGVSIMAMEDSRPEDFGRYPLTEPLINALCETVAKLAALYGVPIDADHIMTHAEAALHDGYFGTEPEERWDIARLVPEERPLVEQDAHDAGDELRTRIKRAQAARTGA